MANLLDRMSTFHNDAKALAPDLIALLDRYIFLTGHTLTTNPIRPETTLPPILSDNTPIAIQMYDTPSLSSHLSALDRDIREKKLLDSQITRLVNIPTVKQAADKLLDSEFASLPPTLQPRTTAFKSLTTKLANLRSLQERAAQLPPPPEFKTHVVTSIGASGFALPFTEIYLPYTTSWNDYAEILTKYTKHLLPTADNPPGENMPQRGRWHYQRYMVGRRREGTPRELGCEADFRRLRREVRREGVGVLVWVWDVSFPC